MKLFFRLSMMIFIISFHASYSMNQPEGYLAGMISKKTIFRNCIVDVNQNYELHESNKMTELLHKLLIALAPGGRNLTCFPIINIVQNKNIYYDFITADWVPDFKQIDLFYQNYSCLTNFIPTKPSDATSLAIAQLTQFASYMKYENLTISIRPIIPQQPINLKLKDQVIIEEAQLDKLKAELAQSEAELEARLEKNKLEFQSKAEELFPTTPPIIRIVPAPEPQPITQEHAAAGWRHMPVTKTPAQILAPKNIPPKAVLTTFRALHRSPAEEARIRALQAERITKLQNAAQTPPQSPTGNQPW